MGLCANSSAIIILYRYHLLVSRFMLICNVIPAFVTVAHSMYFVDSSTQCFYQNKKELEHCPGVQIFMDPVEATCAEISSRPPNVAVA